MTRRSLVFVLWFKLTIISPIAFAQSNQPETLTRRLQTEPVSQLVNDARKFGDPRRGAIAFYQPTMNCARCHETQSSGRRLGPDLSEKRVIEVGHLVESVLQPSAKVKEGFETAKILLDDGRQISGILVLESDSQLVIDQIEQPDKPLEISKDQVEEWSKTKTSTMPEGLANQLADRQQFLDLISYLETIAASGEGRAAELKPTGLVAFTPLPEYESRVDHAGLIRGLDQAGLARGEETYRLRCASCHGTIEEEGSMPTSLRFGSGKFKNGNQPYQMYQTLTQGFGMMNPQRWMVPQQKYEVIHYIRQQFIKNNNPSEFFAVTDDYLASLPKGDTRGPKPVVSQPWTRMDYGPSLINTIEVSSDGSNIAQKGIAVRLDDGPGGVESGSHWMMYEHDTMRVAGAWSGRFIDWEGIHFNGTHGTHPRVAGEVHFANPTGPGVGRPASQKGNNLVRSFVDDRVVGRDGKQYGPLPHDWAHYLGMYRFGKQTILKYRVGDVEVLEMPGLGFAGSTPVYTRTFNVGLREREIVLQIANLDSVDGFGNGVLALPGTNQVEVEEGARVKTRQGLVFKGDRFIEIANGDRFEMASSDYSIYARIQSTKNGTIFAQTKQDDEWIPQGHTFFLRGGRPTLDIGWVGAVQANRKVDDGNWHDLVMTWQADSQRVRFFIDGKPAGGGKLGPEKKLDGSVARIGFTNKNFPDPSLFQGTLDELRFYQRKLSVEEVANPEKIDSSNLVGTWNSQQGSEVLELNGDKALTGVVVQAAGSAPKDSGLLVQSSFKDGSWTKPDRNLRFVIPAGMPVNFVIAYSPVETNGQAQRVVKQMTPFLKPVDLSAYTGGGPPNYPDVLTTKIIRGNDDGPFAVDVFQRPTKNPWNCQLRLTGLDFLPDGETAIISAWDGSVWRVTGFGPESEKGGNDTLTWQRIAAGLFQPLGVKCVEEKIYVTCRDQIVILNDLNGDHEADWYECFNSDHQVTEHFHEFAMGLQRDDAGNFYYAKSARHAKTAIVPHHGTLLKVSPDGQSTEIIANGFRAANGVCLNPDGSFVVTDQEGHWNPKNRINWVRPGEFYGNMFGYHDVTDESDSAMSDPLCWITNAFDRSPSELLWVDSKKWGPLNGSLLNFSYGYGKIYVVPHEEVDGQMQGGMCEFPLEQFPTGVMRGRFHPVDGQLYCCGMFAWAGNQQEPGGLYRVRCTGKPVHLPIGLSASVDGIEIRFSGAVDRSSASDPSNYSVNTWDLKRTANYGSKHFNEKRLSVDTADVSQDGQTVILKIPEIKLTWGMEINYSLNTREGKRLQGKIHNSIFKLKK